MKIYYIPLFSLIYIHIFLFKNIDLIIILIHVQKLKKKY